MAKRNKIYELPNSLVKEINKLLCDKKMTLLQIREFINSHELTQGVKISNGGLGRYAQDYELMMAEFRSLENLIEFLPKDINFDKENEIHKLLFKVLNKAILDSAFGQSLLPKDIANLAKASKDLMSSSRDREKIKSELRKEISMQTLEEVGKVAKAEGLSDDFVNKIRKAIF